MIAFTYSRETNKIYLCGWITQGPDQEGISTSHFCYGFWGSLKQHIHPSPGKMRRTVCFLTEHTYFYGLITLNEQEFGVGRFPCQKYLLTAASPGLILHLYGLVWSLLGPGMKRAKLGYYSSQCHFIRWHSFLWVTNERQSPRQHAQAIMLEVLFFQMSHKTEVLTL